MKIYTIFKNIINRLKSDASRITSNESRLDALEKYEDFTSQITVNNKFTITTLSGKRIGQIAYVYTRLTVNSTISSAMTVPIMTMPHTAENLGGMMFYYASTSSFTTRPLVHIQSNGNVLQNLTSTLASGVIVEFQLLYKIVGGVILNLLNIRRVVFA